MTRFILSLLLFCVLPVMAQIGPLSFTNGNTLWLDGLAGNDATAVKYRADKPFKAGTVVKNASVAGDTIFVRPPNLTLTNFLARGVDYQIYANLLTLPDAPPNGYGMFDDRATGATTNSIIAPATDFYHRLTTETDNMLGLVVVTNANSRLVFRGNSALFETAYEQINSNAFFHVKNGAFLDLELNELRHSAFDSFQHGAALFFEKATYARVRVGRIEIDHNEGIHLVEPAGGASSFLLFENGYMRVFGDDAVGVHIDANSLTYTNHIHLGYMVAGKPIVIAGGRNVITADRVQSYVNLPILIAGGHNTIRIKQLVADVAFNYITISGGFNDIEVNNFIPLGRGISSPAGIDISGGTNVIKNGYLRYTNAIAVKLAGTHSTRLENMRIEVIDSAGGSGGNTNWCIQNLTNGLTAQNIVCIAPVNAFAIWQTNVNNHINIEGVLYTRGTGSGTNSLTTITNGIYKTAGAPSRL